MLTLYHWTQNFPAALKLGGGRINIRRQNSYPRRARVDQKIEKKIRKSLKVQEIVAQCREYSNPYLLRDHSISLYITKNTILLFCPNTLNNLSYYIAKPITYLNTLPKLYPILIPYPISCRNTPYLNTWPGDPSRPWARVGRYCQS